MPVNTLTANYEYSRSNGENLPLPIQTQLPEKSKTFFGLLLHFWNLHYILNTLKKKKKKKKISLIAQVFLKLLTTKDVFT